MVTETLTYDIKKGRDTLGPALDRDTKKADKLGDALTTAAGVLAGGVAFRGLSALSNGLNQAFTSSLQFSKGIAEINSILPANEKLTEEATDSIREFSAQFGTDSQAQASAFYQIVSAGVSDTATQLELLEVANQAAVAGLVDITTSVDILTSSVNAYASNGLTATEASDALFAAVREGKTTFDELASSVGRVAPLAQSAGVEFSELTGTLAFLTKSGISTAEAVTGLRAIISGIVKPSQDAQKAAQELGINLSTSEIRAKGFAGVLEELRDATGGSEAALARLFPNVQALAPVLAITRGNFQNFNEILDSTRDSAGNTAEAAKILQNTLDFQLDRAAQGLNLLAESLISSLEPALTSVVKGFNNFIGLGDPFQGLTADELAAEISNLEAEIDKATGTNAIFNAGLSDSAEVLQGRLEDARAAYAKLRTDLEPPLVLRSSGFSETKDLLAEIGEEIGLTQQRVTDIEPVDPEDTPTIKTARAVNEKLSEVLEERRVLAEEQRLANREFESEQEELDFETLEENLGRENAIKLQARENLATKEEEIDKARLAKEKALFQARLKAEQDFNKNSALNAELRSRNLTRLDLATQSARVNIAQATANLLTAVAGRESKAAFAVQKAAAIAQSIVATNVAAAQALAVPPSPNVGLAALAQAAGRINTAAIIATAIQGFQDGGVIGNGSLTGDRTLIRANRRERVLTAEQNAAFEALAFNRDRVTGIVGEDENTQAIIDELRGLRADMASQPVSVQVDGREIARVVRDESDSGFRIR